jgi:ribosomal protein S19E (S16A)
MNDESDFDLRPDHWEALKALRTPLARLSASTRLVLDDLVALGLVTISDRGPAITEKGRKALIRGSFRLLDAAA